MIFDHAYKLFNDKENHQLSLYRCTGTLGSIMKLF